MFSDSRQDAAFFAPYLDRTYSQLIARRLVWRQVEGNGESGVRFNDCVEPIARFAEQCLLLDPDERTKNRTTVRSWLVREALAIDPRQSLDGVGLMETTVEIPRAVRPLPSLSEVGFSFGEMTDLVRVLVGTLRASAALELPPGVDIDHPMFAPRNLVTTVRREQSSSRVLAWMPGGSAKNRRLDYIERVLARRGITADGRKVLGAIWDDWLSALGRVGEGAHRPSCPQARRRAFY